MVNSKNKSTQLVAAKPDCCLPRSGRKVSVSQFGKKLVVDFVDAKSKSVVCDFDGCLTKNQISPDYAISNAAEDTIFAELKGKDVMHAIRQISAGLDWWLAQKRPLARRAGVIVCNEVPRIQTKIQLAKHNLAKKYGAPVHIFSRDMVDGKFDILIEF